MYCSADYVGTTIHKEDYYMKNKKSDNPLLTAEEKEITEFLHNIKFKKTLFGGVDSVDVWRKIDELNNLYEKLLIAERAKNNSGKNYE